MKKFTGPYMSQDCNIVAKFVLTNTYQFKSLKELRIKVNIPIGYEQLADRIGMTYNDGLVYDKYANFF